MALRLLWNTRALLQLALVIMYAILLQAAPHTSRAHLCRKFAIVSNDRAIERACRQLHRCGGSQYMVPTAFNLSLPCVFGDVAECEPIPAGHSNCFSWILVTDPTLIPCPSLCDETGKSIHYLPRPPWEPQPQTLKEKREAENQAKSSESKNKHEYQQKAAVGGNSGVVGSGDMRHHQTEAQQGFAEALHSYPIVNLVEGTEVDMNYMSLGVHIQGQAGSQDLQGAPLGTGAARPGVLESIPAPQLMSQGDWQQPGDNAEPATTATLEMVAAMYDGPSAPTAPTPLQSQPPAQHLGLSPPLEPTIAAIPLPEHTASTATSDAPVASQAPCQHTNPSGFERLWQWVYLRLVAIELALWPGPRYQLHVSVTSTPVSGGDGREGGWVGAEVMFTHGRKIAETPVVVTVAFAPVERDLPHNSTAWVMPSVLVMWTLVGCIIGFLAYEKRHDPWCVVTFPDISLPPPEEMNELQLLQLQQQKEREQQEKQVQERMQAAAEVAVMGQQLAPARSSVHAMQPMNWEDTGHVHMKRMDGSVVLDNPLARKSCEGDDLLLGHSLPVYAGTDGTGHVYLQGDGPPVATAAQARHSITKGEGARGGFIFGGQESPSRSRQAYDSLGAGTLSGGARAWVNSTSSGEPEVVLPVLDARLGTPLAPHWMSATDSLSADPRHSPRDSMHSPMGRNVRDSSGSGSHRMVLGNTIDMEVGPQVVGSGRFSRQGSLTPAAAQPGTRVCSSGRSSMQAASTLAAGPSLGLPNPSSTDCAGSSSASGRTSVQQDGASLLPVQEELRLSEDLGDDAGDTQGSDFVSGAFLLAQRKAVERPAWSRLRPSGAPNTIMTAQEQAEMQALDMQEEEREQQESQGPSAVSEGVTIQRLLVRPSVRTGAGVELEAGVGRSSSGVMYSPVQRAPVITSRPSVSLRAVAPLQTSSSGRMITPTCAITANGSPQNVMISGATPHTLQGSPTVMDAISPNAPHPTATSEPPASPKGLLSLIRNNRTFSSPGVAPAPLHHPSTAASSLPEQLPAPPHPPGAYNSRPARSRTLGVVHFAATRSSSDRHVSPQASQVTRHPALLTDKEDEELVKPSNLNQWARLR